MRHLFLSLALIPLFPWHAFAQEITAEPICFNIINEADQTVFGSVVTDYVTTPQGDKIHYDGTFRLEPAGTIDPETGYRKDFSEFCTTGPFFPGRRLEIVLRTLIPVFSCKTSIEAGDVVVHSQKLMKDGVETNKIWATCY